MRANSRPRRAILSRSMGFHFPPRSTCSVTYTGFVQEQPPELTSGEPANGMPSLSTTAPQLGEPYKLPPLDLAWLLVLSRLCLCFDSAMVCGLGRRLRTWFVIRSLAEMRKDSTTLIRRYLDEMKRMETELALYRRRTRQLQEDLKEARDDLQKDEEIFEEKMREMKDRNRHLITSPGRIA